jgi:hypothetical protein
VPRVNHSFNIKAEEVHGISESLHHFVEKLLREKKTVDSQEYRSRKDACIRALLEDRYGHAVDMAQVRYREVKPPLLRDPSQPHDQMDNFASGKTDTIVKGLISQPSLYARQLSYKKKTQLTQIRKPWGW